MLCVGSQYSTAQRSYSSLVENLCTLQQYNVGHRMDTVLLWDLTFVHKVSNGRNPMYLYGRPIKALYNMEL